MNRKIKQSIAAGFCAMALFGSVAPVSAASLWADESGASINLFGDHKARSVGDLVTIIINESTTTTTAKSNSNSKSGKQSLDAGVGVFGFLAKASASGSDSFKADGSASAKNAVKGRVTVSVVEVKPNGNLVIEGTQSIWHNRDEHKITLRGMIRRDDISSKNTIESTQVADATLKFDGKGPLNAKQRQGILTQIFNILF